MKRFPILSMFFKVKVTPPQKKEEHDKEVKALIEEREKMLLITFSKM